MDIFRLDPVTYQPNELIEDYSSMIWTERLFRGEFQLKTPLVEETMTLLPEGALISSRDNPTVMRVDTKIIEPDENGVPELTVTGLGLDYIFDDRFVLGPQGKDWSPLRLYTSADMVLALIWNQLINPTTVDILGQQGRKSVLDNIPDLILTDTSSVTEAAAQLWLNSGTLGDILPEFLEVNSLGLRTIRPAIWPGINDVGSLVSFGTVAPNVGVITRSSSFDLTKLRLDLFSGKDRTYEQSVNEPVIFQYEAGHLDNPSYLMSSRDLKTHAMVQTSVSTFDVWPAGASTTVSGFNRRALYVDGGSPETDQTQAQFLQAATQKARAELLLHNRKVLFDAGVSDVTPYRYGRDYFLGDLVTLVGEFGFQETMRVTEYVRTDDKTGDRGFPTLVLPDETYS